MWWKELLFTALYTGYFPVASGTAGTLLSMGLYVAEYIIFGELSWMVNIAIVCAMIYPSIKLGDAGEKFFGKKDPPEIVLDEVMGYRIAVLFYPFNWTIALAAFLIFRILDIVKPYPARSAQNLKGGLGVMLDDYIVGAYTNVLMLVILLMLHIFGISVY